jgi:RimJ/RimL family protein N-acetyltransferase
MDTPIKSPAKVIFRDVCESDLPLLFDLRRDLQLQSLLLTVPDALDETALRAWLKRRQEDVGGMFRVIEDTARGDAVGYTQVGQVHRRNRTGYGGISLAANARGRGLGQATLRELVQFARRELGLTKLLSEVRVDNFAALRLNLSVGYRIVGTLEKHFIDCDGRMHDVVLLERLLTET